CHRLVSYLIPRRYVWSGDLAVDAGIAPAAEPATTAEWARHVGAHLNARNPIADLAHLGDHVEHAAVALLLGNYLDIHAGAAPATTEATTATARDRREDVLNFGHLGERRFHL